MTTAFKPHNGRRRRAIGLYIRAKRPDRERTANVMQEHQAQQQEYERQLQRLRDYLEEQEQQRRLWAGEKWGHPGGRLYKLLRVLIPIFTIDFILSAVL